MKRTKGLSSFHITAFHGERWYVQIIILRCDVRDCVFKIRLLPSQGKFRTRLELMAAVNTKETLKELSIEISVVRMELIKQNLVIISFKKHKLGSALGDPFKCVFWAIFSVWGQKIGPKDPKSPKKKFE